MTSVDLLIHKLGLQKHPEGGWFCEYYRSPEIIPSEGLPDRYTGSRNVATAIDFLLKRGDVSHFHQLLSDEIWHFHLGGPVQMHCFMPDDTYLAPVLGPDLDLGHHLHVVLPAGTRFGAHLLDAADFVLVGCTVAPGFDFADFSLCQRRDLLNAFPDHGDVIELLTMA